MEERSEAADGRTAPTGGTDPNLVERPRRRRFSAEYKLRILREAEFCTRPGEVGALLRREGLYTSHLSTWRKQRDQGAVRALSRPRGRQPADPREAELVMLRQRVERAEAELARVYRMIRMQGKLSAPFDRLLEPGAKETYERRSGGPSTS